MIKAGSEHRISRRSVIFGAGCAALAIALPAAARAQSPATGRAQSPINLSASEITFVISLPTITFSYPQTDVKLVNTGSPGEFATVRADVPAGAAFITLSGIQYNLAQFHWHTPSEHKIEGQSTPMEMHLVHSSGDGGVLVISVFIELGSTNTALGPIFQELPGQPGATRNVPGVNLTGLLPVVRDSFRYAGSHTSQPFSEGFQFIVFTESITLTQQQISAFQALFINGNSRAVQPLNGRVVLCDG